MLDTAQVYRNEAETGQGLRESGVPRSELFITTKYSGLKDVASSIKDSLDFVCRSSKVILLDTGLMWYYSLALPMSTFI